MPRLWRLPWWHLPSLALAVTPALADRAHDLAQKGQAIQPEGCKSVRTFTTCHANYSAGRSQGSNPSYDAYLNFLKNQLPEPELSAQWSGF